MTTLEATTIQDKALELCNFVADAPEFAEAHKNISAFMADDAAKAVYNKWQEKGHDLHRMSHEGKEPTDSDLEEFGQLKKDVEANETAASFANAEATLDDTFRTVTKLLQKTLQLGHVPTEADLKSECCNEGGCGCN